MASDLVYIEIKSKPGVIQMKKLKEKDLKDLKDVELHLEISDIPSVSKPGSFVPGKDGEQINEELIPGSINNNISKEVKHYNGNTSDEFITQKEIILKEVMENIPEEEVEELINVVKEEEREEKKDSESNSGEKEGEDSRLNPDIQVLTEKDNDELIILPNEELRKMHNKRNRNQPF